jgi:type II secretory pathway component HofQ
MTGQEAVFSVMRGAKQAYAETIGQLRAKKDEYQLMKRANEDERKVLLEEERKAKSFKFTKMEKKASFLPALKEREGFNGYTSLAPGEKYLDSR